MATTRSQSTRTKRPIPSKRELLPRILKHFRFADLVDFYNNGQNKPGSVSNTTKFQELLFLEPIESEKKPRLRLRRGSVSIRLPRPENVEYVRHPLFVIPSIEPHEAPPCDVPSTTSADGTGQLLYAFLVADIMHMHHWNKGSNGRLFDQMLITQPPVQKVRIAPLIFPEYGQSLILDDAGVKFGDVFEAVLDILNKQEEKGEGEIFNDYPDTDTMVEIWV